MQITGIGNTFTTGTVGETVGQKQSVTSTLDSVGNTFSQILESLNESQQNADNLTTQLATGQNVDIHQVMMAVEENDINFKVALAIRDQLVTAYRELMRTQP